MPSLSTTLIRLTIRFSISDKSLTLSPGSSQLQAPELSAISAQPALYLTQFAIHIDHFKSVVLPTLQ